METRHPWRSALAAGIVAAAGWSVAFPAFAGQDCECIGNGKRVKEGGVICLQIGSSQRYLARCERNLNNTSWKKISDGCPMTRQAPQSFAVAGLLDG